MCYNTKNVTRYLTLVIGVFGKVKLIIDSLY